MDVGIHEARSYVSSLQIDGFNAFVLAESRNAAVFDRNGRLHGSARENIHDSRVFQHEVRGRFAPGRFDQLRNPVCLFHRVASCFSSL